VTCTVPSFVELYYRLKSVLLVLIQNFNIVHVIIEPSLAECNVTCTVPGFVKLILPFEICSLSIDTKLCYSVLDY
jgi:hypothetical protein